MNAYKKLLVAGGLIAALVIVAVFAETAHKLNAAEPVPVLVELFTSQGCQACPQADAVLNRLAKEQPVPGVKIVPLSLHVDYFDARGWRDPYSSATHSRRQLDYVHELGQKHVRTPQMMVGGVIDIEPDDYAMAVGAVKAVGEKTFGFGDRIELEIFPEEGDRVTVKAKDHRGFRKRQNAVIYLAVTQPQVETAICSGANAGKTLQYTGVVRHLVRVGEMNLTRGGSFSRTVPVRIEHAADAGKPQFVAFAQDATTLRVIGIAEKGMP